MKPDIKNQQLTETTSLPNTEEVSKKMRKSGFPRVGAGVLLTGGALVGCFALAVWNRKALATLLLNRHQQPEEVSSNDSVNTDVIY